MRTRRAARSWVQREDCWICVSNRLRSTGARSIYVTNTVKHFKWEPRGKLRIHKKPNMKEIRACRPWLEAELETVRPKLIVCLGAVAAQSLLGSSFKITQDHGKLQKAEGFPPIIATLHPSAILRIRTEEDRHSQMQTISSGFACR